MSTTGLPTSEAGRASAWRAAILDWARTEGQAWFHVVKAVAAALLAMGIAMRLDLPQPRTAMVTVFIVAQPKSGMVLAKGFYRFLGTVAGAIVTVVLTALFPQQPELFLLSVALWVGVCTFGAARYRNFRSYWFVLAGYTAALVGIPAAAHPDGVFLAAMTRVAEVSLGILCAATVSALVFPQHAGDTIRQTVRARFQVLVEHVAQALAGRIDRDGVERINARFVADVVNLEALRSAAVFEPWSTRVRARRIARLNTEFMYAATQMSALQQSINRIRSRGNTSVLSSIEPYLNEIAPLLTTDDQQPVRSAADAAHAASQLAAFKAALPGRLGLTRAQIEHLGDAGQLDFDTIAALLDRFVDAMHAYPVTYASLAVDIHERAGAPAPGEQDARPDAPDRCARRRQARPSDEDARLDARRAGSGACGDRIASRDRASVGPSACDADVDAPRARIDSHLVRDADARSRRCSHSSDRACDRNGA